MFSLGAAVVAAATAASASPPALCAVYLGSSDQSLHTFAAGAKLLSMMIFAQVTGVFCQSAIESAQQDHATVVHAMLENKEARVRIMGIGMR